jgi:hypothetical protein
VVKFLREIYGVESLNNAQQKAGKGLGNFLAKKTGINPSNFITSKDFVRGVRGSHADDFGQKDRAFIGIPSQEDQAKLLKTLQQKFKNKYA